MTHTPGPWRIYFEHVVSESAHTTVVNNIKNEADARLIAAAPEMLECLEAWAESDNEGALPTRERMQKVYDAIAKATGANGD